MGFLSKWKPVIACLLLLVAVSGCSDRLSSTYPKMKSFVRDHGFTSQVQTPAPTNLGPLAPWYGIATKLGSQYIVVIYPTTQEIYTLQLGVNGRLTRSEMIQVLIHKGYQQAEKRIWMNGQTTSDEHEIGLVWTYLNAKGSPSVYFDLHGNQITNWEPNLQLYSFPGK